MRRTVKLTITVVLILLVLAILLCIATAPHVKKIGPALSHEEVNALTGLVYRSDEIKDYRREYNKEERRIEQVQYIYGELKGVQTKEELDFFLLAAITDAFQANEFEKDRLVTISVPFQRDVHELTLKRRNLADFLSIKENNITYEHKIQVKKAIDNAMKNREKREDFFKQYGRIY